MRIYILFSLLLAGFIMITLVAGAWAGVINSAAWVALNVTGWEASAIIIGPVMVVGGLIYAGIMIFNRRDEE